jgi:hypothetical protein
MFSMFKICLSKSRPNLKLIRDFCDQQNVPPIRVFVKVWIEIQMIFQYFFQYVFQYFFQCVFQYFFSILFQYFSISFLNII